MPVLGDTPAPSDSYIEPEMPAVTRLEDLVPFVPGGEVRTNRDAESGAGAVKNVAKKKRSTEGRIRAWATGVFAFFAGIGILLLLASVAYNIGVFNPWGKSPAKRPSLAWGANAAAATAKPEFEVRKVDAYIPVRAIAGNLFVITGTVKNVGNASSRGIRIQATLFGKDNQVLIQQASLAGNYIDKLIIPHMMRAAIEAHLAAARYEVGTGNYDIPPGDSLPFVVVFFDPPGKVESYKVLATNAEL